MKTDWVRVTSYSPTAPEFPLWVYDGRAAKPEVREEHSVANFFRSDATHWQRKVGVKPEPPVL